MYTNPGKPYANASDLNWNLNNFGQTFHPSCLAGYESILCSPWISGFYKDNNSNLNWVPWTNKPSKNSFYDRVPGKQINENWPYSWFSSVPNVKKNMNCYNSFDWFIEKLGGWIVVTSLLSFIWVGIFCLWLYLKIKSNQRAKNRAKYSFNNLEFNDKKKILEDHDFTTADLPFQIWRAYFRGTNTASNQWTIPLEPPMKLKNIVFISSYEEFTTNLNNIAKWKRKEKIWYYILMIFYPPFLPIYVRNVRKKKFKKLRNEIETVQKSIWLNSEERRTQLVTKTIKISSSRDYTMAKKFKKLRNEIETVQKSIWLNSEERRTQLVTKTIKISSSRDYTMAYMDFLDLDKDREFYNGPVLPLTFHLSGDGNFNSPFYINKRDWLVRSLSLLDRSENFIEMYLENLNSYLESLSFYEFLSLSESKFWALIRFLHSNNKGTLKKRSIKAELAILEYINKGNKTVRLKKSSQLNSMNECSQTYIFHFDFINKYPQTVRNIVDYWRYELFKGNKDIKLAIIFSRLDQSTLIPKTSQMDINAISPRSGYMSVHLNEKYNRSSARQTKVSMPHFYEDTDENKEHTSEEDSENKHFGGLLNNFKTNWAEPLLMKDKSDTQFNQSNKNSFSATGSVYSNASYAPNKIEVQSIEDNEQLADLMVEENPLIAFKNRRHGRDFWFRVKIFFVAFYKLVFMRNSLPPLYPMVNLSIMVVLLFVDIFASLMLLLLYMHESEIQYPVIPFVFIYPLTIFISPLIGITSVFIWKASFYRIFLNMNALTCTANIFLTLISEFIIVFWIGDDAKGQIRETDSIEPLIILRKIY